MTYGIQPSGFVIKPLQTSLDEIEAEQRSTIDPQINASASSLIGNLNGVYAARIRELWEKLQLVYASQYLSTASDASLDNLVELVGVTRLTASKSTLSVRLNLDAGISVPAGSVVAVDLGGGSASLTDRFVTTAITTNGGGSTADFDVTLEGEATGPLDASAGTLVIVTPISGWNSATALSDAVVGRNLETDAELRDRARSSLRGAGSTKADAIRSDLLAVSGVTEAFVIENDTSAEPDANGLDAHSFEAVVLGGSDTDVAASIFSNKPAGIATNGTTTESVTNEAGVVKSVSFTRPTLVPIYLEIDLAVNANDFPVDGADQIRAYIEAQADTSLSVGSDVIVSKVKAWACTAVSGVEDVIEVRVGIAASPTQTTNYAIDIRELAQIADDATRIVVNT